MHDARCNQQGQAGSAQAETRNTIRPSNCLQGNCPKYLTNKSHINHNNLKVTRTTTHDGPMSYVLDGALQERFDRLDVLALEVHP